MSCYALASHLHDGDKDGNAESDQMEAKRPLQVGQGDRRGLGAQVGEANLHFRDL